MKRFERIRTEINFICGGAQPQFLLGFNLIARYGLSCKDEFKKWRFVGMDIPSHEVTELSLGPEMWVG